MKFRNFMRISRKKFRTFFAIFVSRPTTKASEFSMSVDPSVQWLMGNTGSLRITVL